MEHQDRGLRPRRGRDGERGAAAVEFALVSVILLTLIAAIIQFAIFFWAFQVGSHAAREGARRYAVDPCNTSGTNITLTKDRVGAAAVGGAAGVTVTPTLTPSAGFVAGDQVTVNVSFTTHDLTGGFVPVPTSISKSATARIEDVEDCP